MHTEIEARVRRIMPTIRRRAARCMTEEATKMRLILPVLRDVLGYDTEDETQVEPEYTADFGTRRADKVDYALMREGRAAVLVEAKAAGTSLTNHVGQLQRYFAATGGGTGRTAILTNGTEWRLYSDLDAANRLDAEPFFVFDFRTDAPQKAGHLEVVSRGALRDAGRTARMQRLRWEKKVREWLAVQAAGPDDDLIGLVAGRIGANVREPANRLALREVVAAAMQGVGGQPEPRTAAAAAGKTMPRGLRQGTRTGRPPGRRRYELRVQAGGREYWTGRPGMTGVKVLQEALSRIWATADGRAAIGEAMAGTKLLQNRADGFSGRGRARRIGTDGPWMSAVMNQKSWSALLTKVRAALPGNSGDTLAWTIEEMTPGGGT